MNKPILVCGSITLDKFESTQEGVPDEVLLGGCGANIAVGLSSLGTRTALRTVVGNDFVGSTYADFMRNVGVDISQIGIDETGTTRTNINRPGLNGDVIKQSGAYPSPGPAVGFGSYTPPECAATIIASDNPFLIEGWVEQCTRNNWRYIFDPGQSVKRLDEAALREAVVRSSAVFVNHEEFEILSDKLGLKVGEIVRLVNYLVITKGKVGSDLISNGYMVTDATAAVPEDEIVDIIGCGDAFRAGFFDAISRGKNPIAALRAGNEFGAKVTRFRGAHGHLAAQMAA